MRWYQKAGFSFVFGTGALLAVVAVFSACPGYWLGLALAVLSVGAGALVANAPGLSGLLRRRLFRQVIRMRGAVRCGCAAFSAAFAPLVADPVSLRRLAAPAVTLFVVVVAADATLFATSPWVTAVKALCDAFNGPIGKGLAMVAVIIGGLMFAFGEGGSKSAIAGLVFGAGMVLAAPTFLTWIGLTGAACTTT